MRTDVFIHRGARDALPSGYRVAEEHGQDEGWWFYPRSGGPTRKEGPFYTKAQAESAAMEHYKDWHSMDAEGPAHDPHNGQFTSGSRGTTSKKAGVPFREASKEEATEMRGHHENRVKRYATAAHMGNAAAQYVMKKHGEAAGHFKRSEKAYGANQHEEGHHHFTKGIGASVTATKSEAGVRT